MILVKAVTVLNINGKDTIGLGQNESGTYKEKYDKEQKENDGIANI